MTRHDRRPPDLERRSQLWPPAAIDLPRYLAWIAKPLKPVTDRLGPAIQRRGPRGHEPRDIHIPTGFVAEVVASGLNAPVMTAFGPDGAAYVVESGHRIDAPPAVRRVDLTSGQVTDVKVFDAVDWAPFGALTGAAWVDGAMVLTNTDRLVRLEADGSVTTLVDGLPGRGDHQVNHPVVGPDGRIYFGVGTATNLAIVGSDNAAFGWLPEHPEVHDVPARDVVLAGRNFGDRDVVGRLADRVETGAFVPFGTPTSPGQVIRGDVKASGAILRCDPDGSNLEVVAWGLRNPYGLAFGPDGRLFATEHGSDARGARQLLGDFDDLYEIEPGRWYGWPDFASGIRLDDPRWGEGGAGREPVLAEFPEDQPPLPVVSFTPHAAANGLAISPGEPFGFGGQAFVACFGDLAPITTPRLAVPEGFKVLRVDLARRETVDFAVNRVQGPASKLPHGGFERPSHCAFGPDGALYVTDFGEIDIAPERLSIRVQAGTGTLWRIRRLRGRAAGDRPQPAVRFPFYLAQLAVWIGAAAAGAAVAGALVRRVVRTIRGPRQ